MSKAGSVEGSEARRRRLRYRAWHRGTLEMDLVLGRFADAELDRLSDREMTQLESLMDAPDPELFAWVLGREPVPASYDTAIFRRLAEFHRTGRGNAGT